MSPGLYPWFLQATVYTSHVWLASAVVMDLHKKFNGQIHSRFKNTDMALIHFLT